MQFETFSNVTAKCGATVLCGDICMWWYLSMVYIYIYSYIHIPICEPMR